MEENASAATRYVFNIHNEGTLIICGGTDEMPAAMGHARVSEPAYDDVAPQTTADLPCIDDGDDVIASAEEADLYGEATNDVQLDDYDPFS